MTRQTSDQSDSLSKGLTAGQLGDLAGVDSPAFRNAAIRILRLGKGPYTAADVMALQKAYQLRRAGVSWKVIRRRNGPKPERN